MMQDFRYWIQSDYDRQYTVNGKGVRYYSREQLHRRHPADCCVIGETRENSMTVDDRSIGTVTLGGKRLFVFPVGTASRLLCRVRGYVQVGEDAFVALLQCKKVSRVVIALLLAGIATVWLLLSR